MRKEHTLSDLNGLVQRYFAVWNEPNDDARAKAIAELWTEDGVYSDPLARAHGHDAIDAVISTARNRFPGYVFRLLNRVDGHHDVGRFNWELVPGPGGDSIVVGFDVAVTDGDNRLKAVYGFLDRIPPN
jgi:hypothetical protein